MTPEQEKHLARIEEMSAFVLDRKYRGGQKEHGGNLWDKSNHELLMSAIEEAVDQLAYLITLHDKICTVYDK